MKNRELNIVVWICLALAALATSVYLLMIGRYNALSLDDYGYVVLTEEEGVMGLIRSAYFGWQCRFSTFFVNGFVYLLFGRASNLLGITVIMLLLGWWSVERLLTGLARRYEMKLQRKTIWVVAVLSVNIGVMAFLEPATFYWLCALNYTFSIWVTIWLFFLLFYSEAPLWIRWIGIILCSIYISGTAENYTPLVILVLGVIWLLRMIKVKSCRFWENKVDVMIFVSLILISIGFVVMLIGPGNKERMEMGEGSHSFLDSFALIPFIRTTIKANAIIMLRLLSRSYYYLLLVPVFLWCGNNGGESFVKGSVVKCLVGSAVTIALLLLFVFVAVSACVLGTGWYAPPRSFCFMSFAMLLVFAYLSVIWGRLIGEKRVVCAVAIVASLMTCGLAVTETVTVQPVVKAYHHYVTERNSAIQDKVIETQHNSVANKETFYCEPFDGEWPINSYSKLRNFINTVMGKGKRFHEPQMILMESELGADPMDWRNQHVKKYFHADFDIVCDDIGKQ